MEYRDLSIRFLTDLNRIAKTKMIRKTNTFRNGEERILNLINNFDGAMTPGMLSDAACISTARIAATLNRLEEKGDITRKMSKSDRRKVIVELTPAGKARVCEIRKRRLGVMDKLFETLGEKDAQEFVRIFGRTCDIFEKESQEKE